MQRAKQTPKHRQKNYEINADHDHDRVLVLSRHDHARLVRHLDHLQRCANSYWQSSDINDILTVAISCCYMHLVLRVQASLCPSECRQWAACREEDCPAECSSGCCFHECWEYPVAQGRDSSASASQISDECSCWRQHLSWKSIITNVKRKDTL